MAYTPAGNLTSTGTLRHLATVYYSRKGLDQLMKNFYFKGVTEPDTIPKRNGKTIQWFRYTLFGANTSPASEGTNGTSLTLDTNTISATVSEYSDYITMSTLLVDSAIDAIKDNAVKQLSYRAAFSVDSIARTEFDSAVSTVGNSTIAGTASIADIRKAITQMEANDVRGREGTDFVGIFHPYVTYDITADNTSGGFIDKMRYADPSRFLTGEVGKVDACRIVKSTNVGTSGSAPDVLYYGYVVGEGAVGSVDLAGSGPSNVKNPETQQFSIAMGSGGPSLADPTGAIGAWMSYRFTYVAKILDSTTYRYRIIKGNSSII